MNLRVALAQESTERLKKLKREINIMDFTLLVAFIAFFGMVLAWLAAPSSVRVPVMMEASAVGAD